MTSASGRKGAQSGCLVVSKGSSPPGRKNSHDTILRDIKDSIGKGIRQAEKRGGGRGTTYSLVLGDTADERCMTLREFTIYGLVIRPQRSGRQAATADISGAAQKAWL